LKATGQLVAATYALDSQGNKIKKQNGQFKLIESCHKDQASEYAALGQAALLNQRAAWESASWGRMQVLGSNHAAAGFPGADGVLQMVESFQASEAGQIVGGLNFIRSDKQLDQAMKATPLPNFRGFASHYNGKSYAVNHYDTLLAKAYNDYSDLVNPPNRQIVNVRRERRTDDATLGTIQYLGEHICYSLEDSVRPAGVFQPGITAIEPGLYEAQVTFSPKFQRETVQLNGVPHHSDGLIRVHEGGNASQSLGCLLTGLESANGELHRQRDAEDKVTALVRSLSRQGKVYFNVG
jgi:hypothetical protein